ncbi:MAG: hypothetical protein HYX48_07730 [Chlamydiales bacterium]|nr:hypothetical protein [Chlamydiales bacterium]
MSAASLGAALSGLESGVIMATLRVAEVDGYKKSGSGWDTLFVQLIQQVKAIEFTEGALRVVGRGPLPQLVHAVICLTPILLVLARDQLPQFGIESEALTAIANFVEQNISILFHVAALVSSVVQIIFGNMIFGAVAFATLSVGVLYEYDLLPECVKEGVEYVALPLMIGTGLVSGLYIDTMVAALTVIGLIGEQWNSSGAAASGGGNGEMKHTS